MSPMRFPISTFGALSAYLLASTLTTTSAYRPPPGGNGWSFDNLDRMSFSYVSKEDLVKELISPDGDVLIRNIEAADHIEQCAARFSGGHKLGRKYAKDKSRDSFTLKTQGPESEWILTDEHLLMDEGIILSSGIPDQLNWQHGDGWTKDFGKQGDAHLQTTVKENSHVVGYASSYVWDTFDACWISFEFKCNSTAYIPEVSFDYIFGSEEYYEYVYSDFNDAFGFYIYTEVPEVPLQSRTFSSEAENIARIPNPGWYFRDGTECLEGETRTESSSAGTVVVQCEQFDIVSINNVNYNRNWRDYFNGNDPEASGFSYGPDGEQWHPVDGVDCQENADGYNSDNTLSDTATGADGKLIKRICTGVPYPGIEADGFTDVLQARAVPNNGAEMWNEMKLAVGDVGDHILDSWVLLGKESFTCQDITQAPSTSTMPSESPSIRPSTSSSPSQSPSISPSNSRAPSFSPSLLPTESSSPSTSPSYSPTTSLAPSTMPTLAPSTSMMPSESPSFSPTVSTMPTASPTGVPSISTSPSESPSMGPTESKSPSESPSEGPTLSTRPTTSPSDSPTISSEPTYLPTDSPSTSKMPSASPTDVPSASPTDHPSQSPSVSSMPSIEGSLGPSISSGPTVSTQPTAAPSDSPTISTMPSASPSASPTVSSKPTTAPSDNPTISTMPSESPSLNPTVSAKPTGAPSDSPTTSKAPSSSPTALGAIGPNTVFNDTDEDGVQDNGEDPLSGVTVNLYCEDADGSFVLVNTVVTDEAGSYEFTGISPAPCYVQVDPQVDENSNYVFSPVVDGGNQIYPNGTTPVIDVNYNDVVDDVDVGMYLPLAEVGPNTVFDDLDNDGVMDDGEGPLSGVQITLNCDGQVVGTAVTGDEGTYYFDDVQPGDCYVSVSPEVDGNDGYVFSPVPEEFPVDTPTNSIGDSGNSPTVTVGYNDTVTDWNVGMHLPLAGVGPNTVFNDVNENGVQDSGEEALPGVQVSLECDGSVVGTMTTDDSGTYEFTGLHPASACMVSVNPDVAGDDIDESYIFSPVVDGGNQIFADGNSNHFSLGYDQTVDTIDVGMYLPPATIGPNEVFDDLDGDGVQEDGEPPLANVTINLFCKRPIEAVASRRLQLQEDGMTCTSDADCCGGSSNCGCWCQAEPNAELGAPGLCICASVEPPPNSDEESEIIWELVLVETVVTDEAGQYQFDDVQPGLCYVEVDPDDDYVFSPVVDGGNQVHPNGTTPVIEVDYNDNVDDWNVGLYSPVTVGNKVWDDLNGNGVQEDGEPGIQGVPVTLVDGSGNVVDTTSTGADGFYTFEGLPPGDYAVEFDLPTSYTYSPPGDSDLLLDVLPDENGVIPEFEISSDILPNTDQTPTQTLTSGEINNSFDTGIYIPVVVNGVVWDDLDANGIQDDGEPELVGATIYVMDASDPNSPSVVGSDTTGDDGSYSVSLPPGVYKATIAPPLSNGASYTLSPLPASVPDGAEANDFDPNTWMTAPLTLESGGTGAGSFDAGFYTTGVISSSVWNDDNANGIREPLEGPYTGPMTVNVYPVGEDTPVASTTTNPVDGSYTIENVPPGDYEVEFVPGMDGITFTTPNAGDDESLDSDVDPVTGKVPLTIQSGDEITDLGVGVTANPSIGPNQVFEDLNADGLIDRSETGLSDVAVALYDCDGNYNDVTTTDSEGFYEFPNVEVGCYFITVNKEPDFEFSPVVEGGNQISANPSAGFGNSSPTVELNIGDKEESFLIGMYQPVAMGNRAWNDLNGNGIQDDGEPGMPDVIVYLRDESGNEIDSTSTDVDGNYSFEGLTPAKYAVRFDLVNYPDFVFTIVAKSSTPINSTVDDPPSSLYSDVTSDADRETGITSTVQIFSGTYYQSADAGAFIPVIINGTTWHDRDADGLREDGEEGLLGSTVELFSDGELVAITVTDANGYWIFDDQPPGTYYAALTPPLPEYELSPLAVNGTDFDPETFQTAPVSLVSGESGEGHFDAGLYLPATIGDRVWVDETPNGIQDFDEVEFDNSKPIIIELRDELGYLVDSTETDNAGMYSFTGVKPGTYDLTFILPDEENVFTLQNAGNDTALDSDVSPLTGTTTVTVVSAQEKLDVDAGVMDAGPYYPDWTNDVQVCTNDGFDPAWLEIQEVNYLYKNKEDCCKAHFWWRMTQCMANEEFKFFKTDGDKCDSKIYFEDWESNSGELTTDWTDTTLFDTVEECCANTVWYKYDECVAASPVTFKFEFCVEVQGLVDPADCQSADIYANVLEAAVNEGPHHDLNETDTRRLEHHETDANITKIGGVSLSKVDGSTVCGGSLGGQGFINDLTGTAPDVLAAADSVSSVCGVFTVEADEGCTSAECLDDNYNAIRQEMTEFTNSGDLTVAIKRLASERLPPVPELQSTFALPFTFTSQNLLLPATIAGNVEMAYVPYVPGEDGGDTCIEIPAMGVRPNTPNYPSLYDCCQAHRSWAVEQCCQNGPGGCSEIGVRSLRDDKTPWFYPTWESKRLCSSKMVLEPYDSPELHFKSLEECCDEYFTGVEEHAECMLSLV